METFDYTTVEEQIAKLKSQNLIISDEAAAKVALTIYGYSNLIKSYCEPYTIIIDGQRQYRNGVTFDQLYSLYILDKNLRNAVMASMLDLEEHIKATAAEVIAKSFGTHPDEYLNFRNYSNRRKRKKHFTLTGILDTLNKTLNTGKDPIHHYKTVHEIVPPWILFKSIYFTTIVNFVDLFKTQQKNEMFNNLYDLDNLHLSEESGRMLMMDTLFICLDYRNTAAHGGRTYNHQSDNKLRAENIFGIEPDGIAPGFGQFLFLLRLLRYKNPFLYLDSVLSSEVNRHCSQFPQDVTYLGQILNMNITAQEVVWISPNSNKCHSDPHCSGMKNAIKIPFAEAKDKGYVCCKKCN